MLPVIDGIDHATGCPQKGRYQRYEERSGHSTVFVIKACEDCRRSTVLWTDDPFGPRLSSSQKRRLERQVLRRRYTQQQRDERRQARDSWITSGRKGHAPGCRRQGKELVAIGVTYAVPVAYATREYIPVGCSGCAGKFDDVLTY